ncbi:CDC42 small effector protein 2 [Fukomys damarensis]|uniref:CDC42 small effector protein 2 n=1 Tax=Fukomys damarensis TaxID=885580 RepID=A0A091CMS6_FUKDA|nr:CDC42 small effector protein 2 [Fukomys damarensis]
MIREPANFVHMAHVRSGDLLSGMNSVSSIQNQMQAQASNGCSGRMVANMQMQPVDTKAGEPWAGQSLRTLIFSVSTTLSFFVL